MSDLDALPRALAMKAVDTYAAADRTNVRDSASFSLDLERPRSQCGGTGSNTLINYIFYASMLTPPGQLVAANSEEGRYLWVLACGVVPLPLPLPQEVGCSRLGE